MRDEKLGVLVIRIHRRCRCITDTDMKHLSLRLIAEAVYNLQRDPSHGSAAVSPD